MSHLDDTTLQAYLDGELGTLEAEVVRRAAKRRPEVARRLEELRRLEAQVSELLEALDEPLSQEGMRAAEARVFGRAGSGVAVRGGGFRWRRAAVVALLVAGGGAMALAAASVGRWYSGRPDVAEAPVSPVPRRPAPAAGASSATPAAPVPPSISPVERTELGVSPREGALEVRIGTLRPGVRITVDAGATGEPRARAEARARFRSGTGLIEITEVEGPVFVALPRTLDRATVRIDGKVVLVIRAGVAQPLVSAARQGGDTLVFLSGASGDG